MQYILKKGVWRVFSALDGLTTAEQETELHCICVCAPFRQCVSSHFSWDDGNK